MSVFAIGQLVVVVVLLGIGSCGLFAERRQRSIFQTLWLTGLFLIICRATNPWLIFSAAIGLFLSGLCFDARTISIREFLKNHAPQLLGIVLVTTGTVVCFNSTANVVHGIGVVSTIVGLGGTLNWFPFPLVKSIEQSPLGFVNHKLLPVLAGAVFLLRMSHFAHWNEQELAFLAVASLFSLGIIALRLHSGLPSEKLPTHRTLAIVSHANLTTVLTRWTALHPQADWSASSNLPTGLQLFVAILVVESLAVIVLTFQKSKQSFAQQLAFLSLAGIPPFPGAWWRFALLTSLVLPHHRSSLTGLTEPHHGFLALGVVYLAILAALGTGQLESIRRQCDVDDHPPAKTSVLNWSFALILLIVGMFSLSIQPWFQSLL